MCWKAAGFARRAQRHPTRLRGQRRGQRCHRRHYCQHCAADQTRPPAARAPAAKCGWCRLRVAPGLLAVAARQAHPAQAAPLAMGERHPTVCPRPAAHSGAATPPRPETGLRAAGGWRCERGRWGRPWACGVWRDSGANATACPAWVEAGHTLARGATAKHDRINRCIPAAGTGAWGRWQKLPMRLHLPDSQIGNEVPGGRSEYQGEFCIK